MKKGFLKYLFISFFLVMLYLLTLTVYAEDGAEFTVTPIYGEGQVEKNIGYFFLKADSNKKYPITISIQNMSDTEETFLIKYISATTSDEGDISYSISEKKKANSSLPVIEDFLADGKKEQKISIKSDSSNSVMTELNIPKEGFEGTILGSVYVQKISSNLEDNSSSGIRNVFAMSVPVVLSQDANEIISPIMSLKEVNVYSEVGKPNISVGISNDSPTMFGEIEIDGWITKKDDEYRLLERKVSNYEMAPNSYFNYNIETDSQIMKPGTYTYHVKVVSGKKSFDLSKDFEIKNNDIETINETLFNPVKKETNIWLILFVLLLVCLLLIVLYVFYLKNRKKKKKRSRKKKKRINH